MSEEPQFLFVYGTLMSGLSCAMGREQRERLGREARSFGAGSVQGRLYDLGSYPGLVESDDPGERVMGEVLRLNAPSRTLAELDAYEGVGAGDGKHAEPDEYERVPMPARLAGGTLVSAWVYVYRGALTGKSWIMSGAWAPESGAAGDVA